MKINEIEQQLNITRANVRFYEKEGLLRPERGENGYRDYSEADVQRLRQIILLRKLGIPVAEVRQLLEGKADLQQAVTANIESLQKQIADLNGALEICRELKQEGKDLPELDVARYWDSIQSKEKQGKGFADLCRDVWEEEKEVMYFAFFRGLQPKGVFWIALAALFICVVRGLVGIFLLDTTFWEGFVYPFLVTLALAVIALPVLILKRVNKKAASILSTVIVWTAGIFLAAVLVTLAALLLNERLHFWF